MNIQFSVLFVQVKLNQNVLTNVTFFLICIVFCVYSFRTFTCVTVVKMHPRQVCGVP